MTGSKQMAEMLREACIYCKGEINYTGLEPYVKCKLCGKTFAVAKFQSEQVKLKKALDEGKQAEAKLAEAEAAQKEAQQRLNTAVAALGSIDASQKNAEAKLEKLFKQTQADEQTRQAIASLLQGLSSGQQEGKDTLNKLMRTLSESQSDAGEKLMLLGGMAQKLLDSQGDVLARLNTQTEIVTLLQGMQMEAAERQQLQNDFILWSQSIQEADAQRLRDIQASFGALLSGQRELSDRVDALRKEAEATRQSIEAFQGEYQADKLKALEKLYHQAENDQRDRRFDEAAEGYRKMLVKGSSDVEVYWRLVLCHYCVDYQLDDDGNLVPTILNPDLSDPEEISARRDLKENIDKSQRFYLDELKRIDDILDRYREVQHEMQFDVFISVKQQDDGHPTNDGMLGLKLYDELTSMGLKVFNSERKELLPAGHDYEPYIIAALMSSKALIVVGSRPEYMNAQWVRNEWSRFQWLQKQDIKKSGKTERLLLCYLLGGMNPYSIPKGLNPSRQAIVDGFGANKQLESALSFLMPKGRKGNGGDGPGPNPGNIRLEAVLRQMTTWLYIGQFDKVTQRYNELLEQTLFLDQARLHLRALCALKQVEEIDQLAELKEDITKLGMFRVAQRMCTSDEDRQLLERLKKRNEEVRRGEQSGGKKENGRGPQTMHVDPPMVKGKCAFCGSDVMYRMGLDKEICHTCGRTTPVGPKMAGLQPGSPEAYVAALKLQVAEDDANAQYELGLRYLWGKDVPQDAAMGQELLIKAARKGDERAIKDCKHYGIRWQPETQSGAEEKLSDEEYLREMLDGLERGDYTWVLRMYEKYVGQSPYQNSPRFHLYALCAERGVSNMEDLSKSDKVLAEEPKYQVARRACTSSFEMGKLMKLVRDNEDYRKGHAPGEGPQKGSTSSGEEKASSVDVLMQMQHALVQGRYDQALRIYKKYYLTAPYKNNVRLHLFALCAERGVSNIDKLASSTAVLADEPKFRAAREACTNSVDISLLTQLVRSNEDYILKEKGQKPGGANGGGQAQDNSLRARAERGDKSAQFELGACYNSGKNGYPKDYAEAAKWFEKAARQGDSNSQYNLGLYHHYGWGVAIDMEEAGIWYRKAAEQGHALAQNNLGWMYEHGVAVPKDEAEAAKWFRKSAEQGFNIAQHNLGGMLRDGRGVKRNYMEAAEWFLKAANQGHADAQYDIGEMYFSGRGVPMNRVEAIQWYRKAAEQGLPKAQNSLAMMMENGAGGIKPDQGEVAQLYRKAAESGMAQAQYNLGRCYEKGIGVKKDRDEAIKWYRQAAEKGDADAKKQLEALREETNQASAGDKAKDEVVEKTLRGVVEITSQEVEKKKEPKLPRIDQMMDFWRQNLPAIHNTAAVGPAMTPKLQKAVFKIIETSSDELVIGAIYAKMGFGQGTVALVVTSRRIYLSIGEKMYPLIAAEYMQITEVRTAPMNSNPKKRVLTIHMKNGNVLTVANPSNAYKDTINFECLANSLNALVKIINNG